MSDFSDYPMTMGELRAAKSEDAEDWSVRDMLIALLRDIDQGAIEPKTAFVAITTHEGEGTFRNAGGGVRQILGTLEMEKFHYIKESME